MGKRENFNDLIKSIQEAFLQVNKLSEMQHIDMLKNYFDDNENPVCIDIKYPYFDEYGATSYKKVSVPKLCLVPMSSLKLNEVSVDFKVKLYGKIELKENEEKEEHNSKKNERNINGNSYLGYLPSSYGVRKNKDDSYASISLKFVSEQPPEGLLRISDELIKIMI